MSEETCFKSLNLLMAEPILEFNYNDLVMNSFQENYLQILIL